jgi:hypothetical protein
VGRNFKQGAIRQQQQHQRDKCRDHEREAWNLRKDERRFVLRDRAGPGRQGTRLRLAMMAGITIPPCVEMETPGGTVSRNQ